MLHPNTPTISSYCHWDEPQCIQVTPVLRRATSWWQRLLAGDRFLIEVRDTKAPWVSPTFFTASQWRRFLREQVAPGRWWRQADGRYHLGELAFTHDEVVAFRAGVLDGEFDLPPASASRVSALA